MSAPPEEARLLTGSEKKIEPSLRERAQRVAEAYKGYDLSYILEGSLQHFQEDPESELKAKLPVHKDSIKHVLINKKISATNSANTMVSHYYALTLVFHDRPNTPCALNDLMNNWCKELATPHGVELINHRDKTLCLNFLKSAELYRKLIRLGFSDEMLAPLVKAIENESQLYNVTQTQESLPESPPSLPVPSSLSLPLSASWPSDSELMMPGGHEGFLSQIELEASPPQEKALPPVERAPSYGP